MTRSLLDPAFVRELEALRRLLRTKARSGRVGGGTSARRGGGSEFEEHRPYAPGDDMGRLDWLAFARTGQPVSKQHRADEDTVVRLVVDASRSLEFGDPRPIDVATRIAASIGYLGIAASERTSLVVAGGDRAAVRVLPPSRGRAALAALLRELGAVEPAGRVDLSATVERTLAVSERPGVLVVISDFLDRGPVLDTLRRARFEGHDVSLVQVLTRETLEPSLEGDLTLVDSETNETLDVLVDVTAIAAYRRRVEALFESLRKFARTSGASYVRAITDEPLSAIVRRILLRAID